MTEFRVAGVRAGYHTGESLTTRGGSWSVELRASAHLLALRGHGGHPSTHPSVYLSVRRGERDKPLDFPFKRLVSWILSRRLGAKALRGGRESADATSESETGGGETVTHTKSKGDAYGITTG